MNKLAWSFPLRLSIWICATTLIIVAIIASIVGYIVQTNLREELNVKATLIATDSAIKLNSVFLQAEQVANVMETSVKKLGWTADNINKYLDEVIRTVNSRNNEITGVAIALEPNVIKGYEYFFSLSYRNKDKEFDSTQVYDKSLDYQTRDWYANPKSQANSIWNMPFYSEGGMNGYLLTYSKPIVHNNKVIGVVVIDVMVEDLAKFITSQSLSSIYELSPHSEIFVLNQFAHFVVYPKKQHLIGETIYSISDLSEKPLQQDLNTMQSIFKDDNGRIQLNSTTKSMGHSDLYYATSINGWVVGVLVPEGWKNSIIVAFAINFFSIVFSVLAVVVLVVYTLSKNLSKPLGKLSEVTEKIGSGDFSVELPEIKRFDEVGVLTQSFHNMQDALIDYTAQLEKNLTARERAEGELNAAKIIQMDLLPRILPPVPTSTKLVCSANLIPARGVGGDLYDVIKVSDDLWALIIGDVSGKGIPASLFMAITATLQRSLAIENTQSSELVTKLNVLLSDGNSANMFVTYWCGILNEKTGELTYTNAGHNRPLIKHIDGNVTVLKKRHGAMLGVFKNKIYDSDTITLNDGDMLILYTDGVVEAFNANDEQFGDDNFISLVTEKGNIGPKNMVIEIENAVNNHANGFEQTDDITILITQYGDSSATEKTLKVPAAPDQLEALLSVFDDFSASKLLNKREQNVVRVCIEEVFANVVNHGYQGKSGEVTVRIWVENNEQLRISFADNGVQFNPLDHPEVEPMTTQKDIKVGGLGIHLVRKKMDYTNYQYENGYNILTIGKNINAE